MLVEQSDFNPIDEVVTAYIKRKTHVHGTSKKAEEIANASDSGYQEGLAQALAHFANADRVKRIPPDLILAEDGPVFFEAFGWYELSQWLFQMKELWRTAPPETDEEWRAIVAERWDALIWPPEMAEHWDKRRRAAIRMARLDPKPSDAAWLREELDKQRENLTPLEQLITKAEKANTGSIRGLGVAGNPDR